MHVLHFYYHYWIIVSFERLILGSNCGDLVVSLQGSNYNGEGVVNVCQNGNCGYLCLDNFTGSQEVNQTTLLSEVCHVNITFRNSSGYNVSWDANTTNVFEPPQCQENVTLTKLNSCHEIVAVYCENDFGEGKGLFRAEEIRFPSQEWGKWEGCLESDHRPVQYKTHVSKTDLTWTASRFQGTEIQTECHSETLDIENVNDEANRILQTSEIRNFTVKVTEGSRNITKYTCIEYVLEKQCTWTAHDKYSLCIAQKNGFYFVHPCNLYLPMLCSKNVSDCNPHRNNRRDSHPTHKDFSIITTEGQTGKLIFQENDALSVIEVVCIAFGVTLGLVCIGIISYTVRRFKTRRKREGQIRNSVVNRTYTGQEMVEYERISYDVLPGVEPEVITPPPLPPREVFIEDYGSPSDVLDPRNVTEYAMTFDDTRRKRSNSEGALKVDCFLNDRISATKSLSVFDETIAESNSEICVDASENVTLDIRKRFRKGKSGSVDDSLLLPHAKKASVSEDSDYEDTSIIDGHFKKKILSDTCCTHIHGDSHKDFDLDSDSEYEDTTVFDENLKRKSNQGLFEKHVCLECIPDDILKKLGIRIVRADDTYSSSYSRYSDGPLKRPLMIKSYENIDCDPYPNENNSKAVCRHNRRKYEIDSKMNERLVVNGEYDTICNIVKLLNNGDFLNVYDHISNISRVTSGMNQKKRSNSV